MTLHRQTEVLGDRHMPFSAPFVVIFCGVERNIVSTHKSDTERERGRRV